jgi:hypothetical protein
MKTNIIILLSILLSLELSGQIKMPVQYGQQEHGVAFIENVGQFRTYDFLEMEITTPSLRDTPPYQGGENVGIDVSHLSPGVYFVRVGNIVRKFV